MEKENFGKNTNLKQSHYKRRNILTLEERVNAIRAYESHPYPSYQWIANIYHCSPQQINKIIANKDAILFEYANTQIINPIELQAIREDKINFLNKVVFEFMLRVFCRGDQLNREIVHEIAMKAKEAISIENFDPKLWLNDFIVAYNISSFSTNALKEIFTAKRSKQSSLKCSNIIQYVRQHNLADEQRFVLEQMSNEYEEVPVSECTPDIPLDFLHDDSMNFSETLHFTNYDSANFSLENHETSSSSLSLLLPDINSCEDALRYLKVLEDFALIKANYRAIGLITQLEQVFKYPPQDNDFEP